MQIKVRNLLHGIAVVALGVGLLQAPVSAAEVRPPLGLQLYCLQNKAQCRQDGASSIAASEQLVGLLRRVNRQINAAIVPRADGVVDRWTANASAGDCEDYVLAKRQALIRQGVPGAALRIAYTKTRSGEGHAVLVVRTGSGDLVLDNLTREVKLLADTGYRIERMSTGAILQWASYR